MLGDLTATVNLAPHRDDCTVLMPNGQILSPNTHTSAFLQTFEIGDCSRNQVRSVGGIWGCVEADHLGRRASPRASIWSLPRHEQDCYGQVSGLAAILRTNCTMA
ncbi:hypothetical protein IF2G_10664 [Cordyceps javanica]|nr:hypothetical protein IF2G_10664 [Cordyceps javanica]